MSRRAATLATLTAIAAASIVQVHAEPGPAARIEIDHLLAFIQRSTCRFVRNGREYDAERAHRHVIRKFDYFENDIRTAEEFIEYSAARSTVSGKPYQFVCDGVARDSSAVLLAELARFRARRSGD